MFVSYFSLQKMLSHGTPKPAEISDLLEVSYVSKLIFKHIMNFKFYYLSFLILLFISIVKCKDSTSYVTGANVQPIDVRIPSLISPEIDSKQAATVLFRWEKLKKAESYNLNISVDKDFNTILLDSVANLTTIKVKNLAKNSTLFWRVRAIFGNLKGKWSGVHSFTTTDSTRDLLPAPKQIAPSAKGKNVSLKPKFEWKPVDGADGYELDADYGEKLIIHEQVDGTFFTPKKALLGKKTYYWRVRATNGKWSEVHSFTTINGPSKQLPAPKQVAPSAEGRNVSLKPKFEWKPVDGADGYELDADYGEELVIHEQVDGTFFTPKKALLGKKTYYWRVRAIFRNLKGEWSAVHSFTTKQEENGNSGNASSYNTTSDREALMDLYNATNGSSWDHNSGWDSNKPLSDWYGIETDGNGHVTRLDLYKNNLRGRLPKSIGNLDKVTYLNLKGNHLTGEIPSTIGNMGSLEQLILAGRLRKIGTATKEPPQNLNHGYHPGKGYTSTNDFSGKIPSTIGNLSNLRLLEIAQQKNIKGPIPPEIGNLSNLEGLYLNFDDFSGTQLPSSIGRLRRLKHLFISSAQLTGRIPKSFKNLTELRWILFGNNCASCPKNYLTGEIPDFSNFQELRGISFQANEFTGPYPKYWNNGNFTHLYVLRFGWNNLTGTLHAFNNLPMMKTFSVDGNKMHGTIKNQIKTLPKDIIIFGVYDNNFTGQLPQNGWPKFTQLRNIYVNKNDLSGRIPCEMWTRIDNPDLKRAWFSDNDFSSNCTSAMNKVKGAGSISIEIKNNMF